MSKSVCPPLYLTTSFERSEGNPSYSRTTNPNFDILRNRYCELYGTDTAVIYPSGINAIWALFDIYAGPNVTFLVGNELYCDTNRILRHYENKYPTFKYIPVDVKDIDHIKELASEYQPQLLFLESCSNPSGHMFDYDHVANIKAIVPGCIVAVDNSWTSAILFNPLEYDVDLVVESASKYIGAGRIIMGLTTGKTDIMDKFVTHSCICGMRASQYDCWIAADNLETLELRMKQTAETSMIIAQFLETHEKVNRVMYPLLSSHPTVSRAQKYLKYGPGVIWFHISKKKNIQVMVEKSEILYATSYGKAHAMIDPWPKRKTKSGIYDDTDGVNGTWLRLAVGWTTDVNELSEQLEVLLDQSI